MSKRIVLTAFLAALAMFVWMSVAHMLLPLGEAGVSQIVNEGPLLAQLATTLPQPGLYMFPGMPPDNDQVAYMKKVAAGPSGLMAYFPKRDFSFGQSLGIEFATELVEALLAVWLLSTTSLSTFGGRLGFIAVLGLLAVIGTNVSYWNWYGFPSTYTCAYMLTGWVGYLCAGAVAALMKIGG